MVHKRILALFGSICCLNDDSVDKRLCRRQMSVKSYSSHSCIWCIITGQVRLTAAVTCNQYYMLSCGADGAR